MGFGTHCSDDAACMQPGSATWDDVVDALALEAEQLGNDVAWDLDRVRQWWESGVETAFAVRDQEQLVSYACAMHLLPEAFDGIVTGRLDPSNLDLAHTTLDAAHHWLGIVITHPAYRNHGTGTAVLAALCNVLSGRIVADVYSEQGRALLERTGWVFVRTGDHPIYTLELPHGNPWQYASQAAS
jgi:GNAT superfamily N-acetyltransferase